MPKYPAQFYRDAEWIMSFGKGTEWHTGAFRPNRERELIKAGVLVPTGTAGIFTVGELKE